MSVFLLYARRILRRPLTLLVSLLLPVLMAIGVMVQYQQATAFTVGLDVTDSVIAQFVTHELKASGITVTTEAGSGAQVRLVVPGSLADAVGHGDRLGASVNYRTASANTVMLASRLNSLVSVVTSVADSATSAEDATAHLDAVGTAASPVAVATEVVGNPNATVLQSCFNMMVFIILLLTLTNVLVFIKDKLHTTSSRILVSSSGKASYFAQLAAVFTLLGISEFGVIMAVMQFGFGVSTGLGWGGLALLLLGYTLFTVVTITMGLLLVSRSKTITSGKLLITSLGLPLAMLGGCLWPMSIMPGWMQTAALALPTTWLTQLNSQLFSGFQPSAFQLAWPLAALALLAAVFIALLSRVPSESI